MASKVVGRFFLEFVTVVVVVCCLVDGSERPMTFLSPSVLADDVSTFCLVV